MSTLSYSLSELKNQSPSAIQDSSLGLQKMMRNLQSQAQNCVSQIFRLSQCNLLQRLPYKVMVQSMQFYKQVASRLVNVTIELQSALSQVNFIIQNLQKRQQQQNRQLSEQKQKLKLENIKSDLIVSKNDHHKTKQTERAFQKVEEMTPENGNINKGNKYKTANLIKQQQQQDKEDQQEQQQLINSTPPRYPVTQLVIGKNKLGQFQPEQKQTYSFITPFKLYHSQPQLDELHNDHFQLQQQQKCPNFKQGQNTEDDMIKNDFFMGNQLSIMNDTLYKEYTQLMNKYNQDRHSISHQNQTVLNQWLQAHNDRNEHGENLETMDPNDSRRKNSLNNNDNALLENSNDSYFKMTRTLIEELSKYEPITEHINRIELIEHNKMIDELKPNKNTNPQKTHSTDNSSLQQQEKAWFKNITKTYLIKMAQLLHNHSESQQNTLEQFYHEMELAQQNLVN